MTKAHVPFDKSNLTNADESLEEQAIEKVYEFAARELEYHDALNKLAQGEIDPHAIVNEAFARLLKKENATPNLKPGGQLYKTVLDVMHEKVRSVEQRERREVSLDENVKDAALEGGFRTLGEHVLYFWQPDQDLSAQDVIPDTTVPTPVEINFMKERQAELYQAMDALPIQWRETFVLRAIEKMEPKEIAAVHGITEQEVAKQLVSSQQFLMARMKDVSLLENRPPDQLSHVHDNG